MTANKMPVLPEVVFSEEIGALCLNYCDRDDVADYGRACYLAGIAAARECVPDSFPPDLNCDMDYTNGASDALNHVRANLSALEQGVGK